MKGITFSTEMVTALLEGRKTQTRRLHKKPRFQVGEKAYVREAYVEVPYEHDHIQIDGGHVTIPKYAYKADSKEKYSWKSSRFMPKLAARIFVEITEVREQYLWDINEADAKAEGVNSRDEFRKLWDKINFKNNNGWIFNPRIMAYTFKIEEVKE